MIKKKIILLLIAAALSIIAVVVQQFFSNDRPVKEYSNINGKVYTFKLPVFHEGKEGCLIEINMPDSSVTGTVCYKALYPNEIWSANKLIRMNDNLISMLPYQKPNVKLQYYVVLNSGNKIFNLARNNPVIVRFQEEVPKYIVYLQVTLLFLALIFSCYVGLLAVFNVDTFKKYSLLTYYLMLAGALILSIVVHIYSFRNIIVRMDTNNDLSVYRNLLLFLFWLLVFYINKKKERRFITFVVSFITLIVFCLPQILLFYWWVK